MPTQAQVEARAPIDTSVVIPEAVRRAAEKANSHYGATPPAAAADPQADSPQPDNPPADPPAQPDPPADPLPADPQPPADPPVDPAPPAQDLHADGSINWEHRYRSMKGRWEQSQTNIGQLQEQMSQLGDELMRTQTLVGRPNEPAKPAKNKKLITDADREAYGDELIDVAKRAAQEALTPEIERLQAENNTLKQKVGKTDQNAVLQALDRDVPEWETINVDPRWISWLRLRDIYSGRVRKQLLDDASRAADAPRVVSFFKGFLAEEAATGQVDPASRTEPPAPAPAPRVAAKPLESLAAPGRARPASGSATTPADKPIFTRVQIKAFYDDVRRGVYAGREADKDRQEKEIFSAQNDGRVR